MKELKFSVKGRTACLKSTQYADALKKLLSYSSPAARYSPAYNTRDEDGKRLWDGRTSMFKHNQLPIGLLIGAYKELKAGGFKAKVVRWKDRPSVGLKKGFSVESEKYDYQNSACEAVISSLSKGGGTVLSATGTGKTAVAAQCFSRIQGNCLFVVNRISLMYQTQRELASWLKEKVGIIGNGQWKPERVTVATSQTLDGHKSSARFRSWSKNVAVIFVDELHKQMGRATFNVLSLVKPQAVIGLTATLQMKKKMVRWKVYSISGPIIYEFPLKEGIKQGVLSKAAVVQVNVKRPKINSDLYTGSTKTLVKKLGRLLKEKYFEEGPERDYFKTVVCNFTVSHFLLRDLVGEALKQKMAVVVLADRVTHIKLLAKALEEYNPQTIYGEVKQLARSKILKRFEHKSYNFIIASRIFTEGLNVKRISMIVDCAQKSNQNDAMQKLGRGARLHKDKKHGLIYVDISTSPEMMKQARSRRNVFKKAGLPVKVLDWELTNGKEIIRYAHDMLKNMQV